MRRRPEQVKHFFKSNTLLISVIAERFIYRPHPFVLLKCDSILQIPLRIRVFGQPWIEISCHHIIFFLLIRYQRFVGVSKLSQTATTRCVA